MLKFFPMRKESEYWTFRLLLETLFTFRWENKIPASQLDVVSKYNFDRKKVEIDRVNQCGWPLRLTAEFSFTTFPVANAKKAKRMRTGNKKGVSRASSSSTLSSKSVSIRFGRRASKADKEKSRNSTRDGNARSYNCRAKCLQYWP